MQFMIDHINMMLESTDLTESERKKFEAHKIRLQKTEMVLDALRKKEENK
jgi:hypothetical protein